MLSSIFRLIDDIFYKPPKGDDHVRDRRTGCCWLICVLRFEPSTRRRRLRLVYFRVTNPAECVCTYIWMFIYIVWECAWSERKQNDKCSTNPVVPFDASSSSFETRSKCQLTRSISNHTSSNGFLLCAIKRSPFAPREPR